MTYSTILLVTLIYILFAVWARWMDLRDTKKMNITFMKDNHPNNSYFYELIIFTGDKNESGTNSKVNSNFNQFSKLNFNLSYLTKNTAHCNSNNFKNK